MAKGKVMRNSKPHAKIPPKKAASSKNAVLKKPSALQHNSKTKGSQKWVADDLDDESSGDSSEEPSPRPQKKCHGKQKKTSKEEKEEVVPVNKAQPQSDSEV
jgi:hypothetical protein